MKLLRLISKTQGAEFGQQVIDDLSLIKEKLEIMATKQDQINASLTELNEATNSIANRIQGLVDQLAVDDQVSQESIDQLQQVADQLKAMGQDPNNPIPNPDEPPTV